MAFFITFEGGDGSGKSTLLKHLENHLLAQKIKHVLTREPGGTKLAEEIRTLLVSSKEEMGPLTELLLFEAARSHHVQNLIRPSLESGTNVLCDRFTHSSLAYQGAGLGLGVDLVQTLNQIATQSLEPDFIVWLKISPQEAQKRLQGREEKNRMDLRKLEFHQKVFDAFQTLAQKEKNKFIILDALKSPEEIFQQLLQHPVWGKMK